MRGLRFGDYKRRHQIKHPIASYRRGSCYRALVWIVVFVLGFSTADVVWAAHHKSASAHRNKADVARHKNKGTATRSG
jgi:hypothetical protein